MRRNTIIIILLAAFVIFSYSLIHPVYTNNSRTGTKAIPDSILFTSAPVLSPAEALHTFKLAEGFSIELVASEPLIQDPVAMAFDAEERLWVVEMQSYMPDTEGTGEEQQTGRIVILGDHNGDGRMDHAKVFLDSLVLPRAISIVKGGILYAEPPNLWFVENIRDKPGQKILVDSAYAIEGNPEHLPNGLLPGLDNWYYNAKSRNRYQYRNGRWVKEKTEFRGQWGITKDNTGRLIYNTNFSQLQGDLLPPGMLNRNPGVKPELGTNVELTKDQRVYPIRPTPGINRGYQEAMLDEDQKLTVFTAACGPEIYRGHAYPPEYQGNAFVCEPAGNLIKRNILEQHGLYTKARQAYEGQEFLASTDERFRPVNLYNAPDGSLYVVDMYRGIIQHKTYLTDYLREQIKSRSLATPLGMGRIYRIVYKKSWYEKLLEKFNISRPVLDQASDRELVRHLSHPNGWYRDMAQRLLVERNNQTIVPDLLKLLEQHNKNYGQLHALWTLEGMGIHTPDVIRLGIEAKDPEVVAAALRIGEQNNQQPEAEKILALYKQVAAKEDPRLQLQLALSLGEFREAAPQKSMGILLSIAHTYGDDSLIRGAIASSLAGRESQFIALLYHSTGPHQPMIPYLREVMENAQAARKDSLQDTSTAYQTEDELQGKSLYIQKCAGCHGEKGEGLPSLAPPLAGSEWVTGPKDRLTLVVLHGLEGAVRVKGKVYRQPEVQPLMPGFKDNKELTDEKLAALLTYIRKSWMNEADGIEAATVQEIRESSRDRREPYREPDFIQ